MNKYYRVRTKAQWDWLMKWFEEQGAQWVDGEYPTEVNKWNNHKHKTTVELNKNNKLSYCNYQFYVDVDNPDASDFIEVSQMMEDEKMKDYVTIDSGDLEKIRWGTQYGAFSFIDHDEDGDRHVYEQYLPAELQIPKSLLYPKVKMTQAETDEFDKLKDEMSLNRHNLYDLLTKIRASDYPHLYHRLYVADGDGVKSQLEFARAWADPSLIEVIPEKKWNVRVPKLKNMFYWKNDDETLDYQDSQYNCYHHQQFTAEELKHYGLDNDLFEKVEAQE